MGRFWEKPDRDTAASLFARGCFWNILVLVGRVDTYLRLAERCIREVLTALCAAGEVSLSPTPALRDAYRQVSSTNFSRAILARRPEDLATLAVRGVYWSDWGDPHRIVQTLRRFNRRPAWLPAYMRTQAEPATRS